MLTVYAPTKKGIRNGVPATERSIFFKKNQDNYRLVFRAHRHVPLVFDSGDIVEYRGRGRGGPDSYWIKCGEIASLSEISLDSQSSICAHEIDAIDFWEKNGGDPDVIESPTNTKSSPRALLERKVQELTSPHSIAQLTDDEVEQVVALIESMQ